MTVLVTGGAGFIGCHVVRRLRGEGEDVRVLDDLSSGNPANLDPGVELAQGDVRSRSDLRAALRNVDAVLHLAARTSVQRSWEHPVETLDVNVQGTVATVDAARAAGVRTFIYSSSSSVYGDQASQSKSEALSPQPISPYGHSKLIGEQYALARGEGAMRVLALRYFNVFGPGQDPDSPYAAVIPRFLAAAASGTPVTIHGDGLQSRDFTFVENAVHANLLALRAAAGGRALNVACGRSWTLLDLVGVIERVTGSPLHVRHGPTRPGDIRDSLADLKLVFETIGYRPQVQLEEGIARTYGAYARA